MAKDEMIYRTLAILVKIFATRGQIIKMHEFYKIMKDELKCTRSECYLISSTLRKDGYMKMDDGYCGLTPKGYETALLILVKKPLR